MAIADFLTPIVGILSSLLGVTLVALLYLITHPEKIEKWQSLIARGFSFVSDWGKRTAVSADIQSEINPFADAMNSESAGAMPYGLKIEWTKEVSTQAFIQAGEVIVRMKHYGDQPSNMVYATLAYLSKGFLPHGRHYLDSKVSESADHIMAKKLFVTRKLDDALQLYVTEVLEPELQKDNSLKRYCELFEKLDENALLAAVFAREIEHMGLKLYPAISTSKILNETSEFVDFLEKVVEREPGEELPGGTQFFGPNIRMAIALIARSETLAQSGVAPHLLWISSCWANGIDTVYVTARGKARISTARRIIERLEATGNIRKLLENLITTHDPTGRPVDCLIAGLGRKPSSGE